MSGRSRHILVFLFVDLGILTLLLTTHAFAQNAYKVTLSSLNINTFPHLTAYLDAHDPAGEFTHGLTTQDVTMQENGIQLPVNTLAEEKGGVQFVMAIAPGAPLNIRDGAGVSRYEYLLQGLLATTWPIQPDNEDDFSLLTAGGPQLIHSTDSSSLRAMLESYRPPDSDSAPNLEVLSAALQLVSDTTPRPGMERAVLFITPPQPTEVAPGLQSIITSANQQNIHIFVWLVADDGSFNFPEIDLLRSLASQTGATFFAFSHNEAVPGLESILEPLRYIYKLGYESRITSAGNWQVIAEVNIAGELVDSAPLTFELKLQPPVVEMVNPPGEIARSLVPQATTNTADTVSDMQPQEQQLVIKVTFPDGYPRQIVKTSLYVDGDIVSENTSQPFEQFVWDIRPYIQDGAHILKVEATDNLGLVGQTNEVSVRITVPSTTQELVAVVSRKPWLVLGLAVFTGAIIVLLGLIIAGRIKPKLYPSQVRHPASPRSIVPMAGYLPGKRQTSGQAHPFVKEKASSPGKMRLLFIRWLAFLPWFYHEEVHKPVLAYLDPILGSDEPTLPATLEMTSESVKLGHDSQKADLVIVDPSIESLHAIINQEEQSFRIRDNGTVAGTWVNYVIVPPAGIELKHADIIHLGLVGFRFNLPAPAELLKIFVDPLEPDK